MVRKAGKLPNATTGGEYFKEYKGVSSGGGDSLCAPRAACKAGDRVMVIDDLMATGVCFHALREDLYLLYSYVLLICREL